MIREYQLRMSPEQAATEANIKRYISQEKGLDVRTIKAIRILKRSIDARQRAIFVNLKVLCYVNEQPQDEPFVPVEYQDVHGKPRVVVVGAGPGGLFAALRLIELGCCPVVVERGKDVHERRKDIARISREHKVDAESNYAFGEGGAGAYSDGKLYTRSKKRGSVERILTIFCQHGADVSILADAHPHIGTDKLPAVIEAMRHTILEHGGEVHFQTRMDELIIRGDKVEGIRTHDGREFLGPVILATGHSARDVYRMLFSGGVELEAKGLAIGVRLEHPAMLIDQIQYHNRNGRGRFLPAAEYRMVTQVEGRGVYSFCMCPGGFVVPAASGPHQLVVNGMSPSSRGSRWSNSGMVVEVRPEDLEDPALKAMHGELHGTSLSMLELQEQLEELCWQQGNMRQTAPSQRMVDFVEGRNSADLPQSSYPAGLQTSRLDVWLPAFIGNRLRKAFRVFGSTSRGFLTNDAIVIGVETRTSSPVRIPRDMVQMCHIDVKGLYPCGEGAGYAGGIVSAAIDGERCAEALAAALNAGA